MVGDNWQPEGRQNRIPAAGKNQKCHCFGALDFTGTQFSFQLSHRKRSCEFVQFLEALRQRYQTRLHLVLDNYVIHYSAEVKRYLDGHPGCFQFYFLPTYSPWLNPVETVWRQMKRAVCYNHFYGCLANLKAAVCRYFASHATHQGALRAAA